jgi:DNA modification methylase
MLDTFLGSDTSLIANQKTKRIFYGVGLEPQNVDCSIRRWTQFMEKEGLDYTVKLNGEAWES